MGSFNKQFFRHFFQIQFDTENMEEYLIAEGWERGFMFNMALNVNPTLSFSKISNGKYSQIFTIGFVKKKYPLDFNKDYNHVNGLDESCRSSITIIGGKEKLIDI